MTTTTTTTTFKTLPYYCGHVALGIDPAPLGKWGDGIFELGKDDGDFFAGDKFAPNPDDNADPSAFVDGSGVYYLRPLYASL